MCEALGATEVERHDMGEGSAHVELLLGDSVIMVEASRLPPDVLPTTASVYVYVENSEEVFGRAVKCGATSISEPEDKPYAERGAALQDSSGNIRYLATFVAKETP